MQDTEFEATVNAELARRMKLFREWSAIVPRANRDRKDLSWYINKRNRTRISAWQDVRDLSVGEAGYLNYGEWLGQHASMSDGDEMFQPAVANPDQCRDDASMWSMPVSYSEEQVNAARQILSNLRDILTENECAVWNLSQNQNLGPVEIADVRGVSHVAVIQMLKRIQGKLKKAYARKQKQQQKGPIDAN